jgi:hypothetical protein
VYFLGVKAAGAKAENLTTILGTLTSWKPVGHSRPVTGLLYLYLYLTICDNVDRITERAKSGTKVFV